MHKFCVRSSIMLLLAAVTACGSGLKVSSVQLGRAVNSDGTVSRPTTRFATTDTVYVSVVTTGFGEATIGVRWMYRGRVLGEPKKQVSYRDVAATEFHLQSASGFPPGDYTVEAFLDGQSVGIREFKVN